ncbi:MAG TPA: hypothetical protein VKS22_02300 [Candidatus Binataceae bacterium]|nr:hypothetical protein [Candidatus Binataceae bacterium]
MHDAETGLGADPTFALIDEAKWILASPISLPWIDRALRTFGRANGALILCTQSLAEIDNNEAQTMLESTAIKTFLPNHAAKGEQVRQLYGELGLNEKQIEIVANGVPPAIICASASRARDCLASIWAQSRGRSAPPPAATT